MVLSPRWKQFMIRLLLKYLRLTLNALASLTATATNEHRSALRSTSRFGFAEVLNVLGFELSIRRHL
jgi:hypothetical protein